MNRRRNIVWRAKWVHFLAPLLALTIMSGSSMIACGDSACTQLQQDHQALMLAQKNLDRQFKERCGHDTLANRSMSIHRLQKDTEWLGQTDQKFRRFYN